MGDCWLPSHVYVDSSANIAFTRGFYELSYSLFGRRGQRRARATYDLSSKILN